DAARVEVDLVVDVEAVNVVVQGVKQVKAAPRPDQTRLPPPDEDLPSTRRRRVQLERRRNGHRAAVEERPAGGAVGEARVGQVFPARGVELPAPSRVAMSEPR